MKFGKRILLLVACAALLLISWVTAATIEGDEDKQAELISRAESYLADEIYVSAVPLLEEAAAYDAELRDKAEVLLKDCYLKLFATDDYARRYTTLLDTQMGREDAPPAVFEEAANFYMQNADLSTALAVLRSGVEKTGDQGLIDLYEANRYGYKLGRSVFDEVSEICGGAVRIMRGGKWGLASGSGAVVIPCMYDKISTWDSGRAVVMLDGVVSAVDVDNNRVALLHRDSSDFGNLVADRLPLKLDDGWHLATGGLAVSAAAFEEMGTMNHGAIPAKKDGKWGLLDGSASEWILPNEYDGIITDSLGRAYFQNSVFVRSGSGVTLLVAGEAVGEVYEDARPFAGGFAAVKKNGKWGYIDMAGSVRIDFLFDDALSFGQHLAAVKQGDGWGYISLYGEMVIEPVFLEAKSFVNGSAPVKTEEGWQFISLLEY